MLCLFPRTILILLVACILSQNLVFLAHAQPGTYIIVHVHNPEGVEIGSIELISDMIPISDRMLFGPGYELVIGNAAHDYETHNKPIAIIPGEHEISVEFNGMTLYDYVSIQQGETEVLTFIFERAEFDVSSWISGLNYYGKIGINGIASISGNEFLEGTTTSPWGDDVGNYDWNAAFVGFSAGIGGGNSSVTWSSTAEVTLTASSYYEHGGMSFTCSGNTPVGIWISAGFRPQGSRVKLPMSEFTPFRDDFYRWYVQSIQDGYYPCISVWSAPWTTNPQGGWEYELFGNESSQNEASLQDKYVAHTIDARLSYTSYSIGGGWGPEYNIACAPKDSVSLAEDYEGSLEVKWSSVPFDLTGTGVKGDAPPVEALSLGLSIFEGTDKVIADGASTIRLLATATKGGVPASGVNLVFDIEPSWLAAKAGLSSLQATTDSNGEANIIFRAPNVFDFTAPGFGYRRPDTLEYTATQRAPIPFAGYIRSAAFDIVVEDAEGTASARKSITIFQTPVLLVHGIRPDSRTWNTMIPWLKSQGFYVFNMTYYWELPIRIIGYLDLPDELLQMKETLLSQGITSSKFDIVAHSMGGLVSRYYTTWEGYQNDVRKLVMIGTPHLGSPSADDTLAQLLYPSADSLDELIPGSDFLNELNSKVPNPAVEHFVIVGTNNDLGWWRDIFVDNPPDGDGVVSIMSQGYIFAKRQYIKASHIQETSSFAVFGHIVGMLTNQLIFMAEVKSPVNILVTDAEGQRIGFDGNTGSVVNEMPHALYTGPVSAETEGPQGILIPNPAIGQYEIEAFGIASGSFTISTTFIDANGIIPNQKEFTGSVSPDDRFEYSVVLTPDNKPPIANAGADRTVEGNTRGGTLVTLDGTGSADPDGDEITYAWSGNFGTSTEANPTVCLQLGYNSVTLVVSDGKTNSEPDTVTVSVVDTTPPSVNLVDPQAGYALQDGLTFSINAQDVVSDIASVTLSIRDGSGNPVGFENMPATFDSVSGRWNLQFDTLQLQDGFYTAIAKATDSSGNVGTSAVIPYSIRNWAAIELLPASESNKAGRTMPVKFSIRVKASVDPARPFIYNEELTIKIYKKASPSNILLRTSTFGTASTDYRINSDSEKYITNFKTLSTPATYVVQIYRKGMLIGSFEFKTVK